MKLMLSRLLPKLLAMESGHGELSLDASIGVTDKRSLADVSASNLLKVTIEAAYRIPDAWADAPTSTYSASLQVPLTGEKDQVLLYPNGRLISAVRKESVGQQKKMTHFLPVISVHAEHTTKEESEINEEVRQEHECQMEADITKSSIRWDSEKHCVLDAGAVTRLRQRIVENRLWPLEITRSSSMASKSKTGKVPTEEDQPQTSHCVAYVDMGPLLYPGVSRIYGAYKVLPVAESNLLHKPAAQNLVGEANNGTDAVLHPDMENNIFTEAGTYITVEIVMEKPVVLKRSPQELAVRAKELIPPRHPLPPHPLKADKAEKAVQGFHSQVVSVVEQVLEQFIELYGTGADALQSCSADEMKTELNGALNVSGKYFAFKEQMKYSVVKIVHDKLRRTTIFTDPLEQQAFISGLYVYLVDEMHIALNQMLADDLPEPHIQIQLSTSQLKRFAEEAQLTGKYEQAAFYHQELVVREPEEPSHWCQLGSRCMQTGDYMKAEECFHHALSLQETHQPSLMLCGLMAVKFQHYEEAQSFFEQATRIEPPSVVPWMLLGLLDESQNDPGKSLIAFREAIRLLTGDGEMTISFPQVDKEKVEKEKGKTEEGKTKKKKIKIKATQTAPSGADEVVEIQRQLPAPKLKPDSVKIPSAIYKETLHFLLQNNALQMAERALSHELLCSDGGRSASFLLSLAQLQLLRSDYSGAAATMDEALFHFYQDAEVWALNGHCNYLCGEFKQAQESYERSLDFFHRPSNIQLIRLRLGSIYLQDEKETITINNRSNFEKAKDLYLQACQHSPTCVTWLGLGIACIRLDELNEAEDALTEANHLNKQNPEVWGYLCLICLKCGRQAEAELTYRYAIRLNLQKESLLREIKELQDQLGYGDPLFPF